MTDLFWTVFPKHKKVAAASRRHWARFTVSRMLRRSDRTAQYTQYHFHSQRVKSKMQRKYGIADVSWTGLRLLFPRSTSALKWSFIHIHCKVKDVRQNSSKFSQRWNNARRVDQTNHADILVVSSFIAHSWFSLYFLILFEFWISFIFNTEESSRHDPCRHFDPPPSLDGA